MEYHRQFIITNNMKIEFKNVRLNTQIVITINSPTGSKSIAMDVDHWTEFKKAIHDVDREFYKRFNYQYSTI